MSEDWVEHIVQAKEDLRTGARSGSPADVERELRLEAFVEKLWPELCSSLIAAIKTFNRLVEHDEELEIEGDDSDVWVGLAAVRGGRKPAHAEIKLARGGILQCDLSWANMPQGRLEAVLDETAEGDGLMFRVTSQRHAAGERKDVHLSSLAEHFLTDFFRHI
jgi:hypothetical protein